MGKPSKIKGAIAEREVAKLVEPWWQVLEPQSKFKKTPLSGGWSTPDVRSSFATSGDLVTTAEYFPFTIEVKRRENWAWSTLLAGKRSPVWSWWDQACKQGAEMKKCPLLWFRHSREEWHVMAPIWLLEQVGSIAEFAQFVYDPRKVLADPNRRVLLVKAKDLLSMSPDEMLKVVP